MPDDPKVYRVRVYHRKTGHSCGELWDDDDPVQGTKGQMTAEGDLFVTRFPEYNYELVEVT